MRRPSRDSLYIPLALTAALFAARAFPLSPLVDLRTGLAPPGAALSFPLAHLALTPFSATADLLSCATPALDSAFLAWLALAYAALLVSWKRSARNRPKPLLARSLCYWGLALGFLAWTALGRRAPSRLTLSDPRDIAVDFHSHTNASWDGRRGFDIAANELWHRQSGFAAAFITDHGTRGAAREAFRSSAKDWSPGGYASLVGVEIGKEGLHAVLLGEPPAQEKKLLQGGGPGSLERLMGAYKGRGNARSSFICLPEDWKNLAPERVLSLSSRGPNGFEIYTPAPKAMASPLSLRREALEAARLRGLYLGADSDNHGYGWCSCAWNVMRIPGWRDIPPSRLQARILGMLNKDGPLAAAPLARSLSIGAARKMPGALLEPWGSIWRMLRTFTGAQTGAALCWVWGMWGVFALRLKTRP